MDGVDVAADADGRPVDLQSTTSKAQLDIIGPASLLSNKNELYTRNLMTNIFDRTLAADWLLVEKKLTKFKINEQQNNLALPCYLQPSLMITRESE